jgi:hypothetical protein
MINFGDVLKAIVAKQLTLFAFSEYFEERSQENLKTTK